MYRIEKKGFGYHLTFEGFIKSEEMAQWVKDSNQALTGAVKGFGVVADMRNLQPLPPESKALMETGQKIYKIKGMARSVVILNSSLLTMQFKRIARETGIAEWERYIDASSISNWQQLAIDWVEKGADPEKSAAAATPAFHGIRSPVGATNRA